MSNPDQAVAEERISRAGGIFGTRISLGKYLGIDVGVDISWFFIAVLITWSLAAGIFPAMYEDLGTATYWIMGVVGAIGLFASIILHELSHALVAQRQGVGMRGITLFIFGGVAQMDSEPPSPRAEFLVAIAGPIASFLIAGVCFAAGMAVESLVSTPILGVIGYLASINALLATFNLIPAFPLDGGRVLRSYLWHRKNDLRWATRITAAIGGGFGLGFIVLGVFTVLAGNFVGGMWWALIGIFLRFVARASYQQVMMRGTLHGESLRRFVNTAPIVVPPDTSVEAFVNEYLYNSLHKFYPVMDNGRLVGSISLAQVKEVPRKNWGSVNVGDLAQSSSDGNTVSVDADPMDVLMQMNKKGVSRLLVVSGDQLVGVVTLKDLLRFVSIRMDLENTT